MIKKRKKITKPATQAQKDARERNWNKGQILCLRTIANNIYKSKTTHESEKADLGIIMDATCNILQNWKK